MPIIHTEYTVLNIYSLYRDSLNKFLNVPLAGLLNIHQHFRFER